MMDFWVSSYYKCCVFFCLIILKSLVGWLLYDCVLKVYNWGMFV